DELVRQLVSQSNAGREIIAVGRDKSARTVVLNGELGAERGRQLRVCSAGSNQRECTEIEGGLLVIGFFDGGEQFVAESQVKSEPRSDFQVVECIDCVNLPAIVDIGGHTGDGPAVGNALDETGEGLAAGAGGAGIVVDDEVAAEVHVAASGLRFE